MTINTHEECFALDLMIQIEMMDNRDTANDPLRADEMTVTISRDRYRSLCEYALERLRQKAGNKCTANDENNGIERTKQI